MFHRKFNARSHLILLPQQTREEVDRVNEEHDMMFLYAQVAGALQSAITARPTEVAEIGDAFAAFLLATLKRLPEAESLDRFGLHSLLHDLPRVALQMIYNHFLTDDLSREGESIEVPPAP